MSMPSGVVTAAATEELDLFSCHGSAALRACVFKARYSDLMGDFCPTFWADAGTSRAETKTTASALTATAAHPFTLAPP